MSVRLDEGMDLKEDQKKNIKALDNPKFYLFYFFCINQYYLFFLLATVHPN